MLKRQWKTTGVEHRLPCGLNQTLYSRQGKAVTNFKATLPEPNSDLAEQTIKDPYNFDFLTIDEKAREREIEDRVDGTYSEILT